MPGTWSRVRTSSADLVKLYATYGLLAVVRCNGAVIHQHTQLGHLYWLSSFVVLKT